MLAADAAARSAGIRLCMPASKAQALIRGLVVMDIQADEDAEALDRLALWALRYSPIVAPDPPDGLVFETAGVDHLHGGEGAMLANMVDRLSEVGVAARIAMADSWGAAHALARFGARPTTIIAKGESTAAVLPLPIGALRLPADMLDSLGRLGFETVADLVEKPRAPLTLRFGPLLGRRIDQALGRVGEPIEPVRLEEIVEVQHGFGEPIGAPETIARYAGKLVVELCEQLEKQGLGARRLDLLLNRVDNRTEAIRVGLAQPVRDVRRLTRLLADKIETIDPGFGIEMMRLAATAAEPLNPTQAFSSLVEPVETDITGLVDVLSNRIGESRLYRLQPVASDVPERSVRKIAPASPDAGETWPGHWPRPARLLTPPERIETVALLPDHPPVAFTWRGTRRSVKRADGPERIFGEWWKRDAELTAVRDYFQLEDDAGERFWVYRVGDGEDVDTGSHKWFLHGIFG